jgi:hypothetical protein
MYIAPASRHRRHKSRTLHRPFFGQPGIQNSAISGKQRYVSGPGGGNNNPIRGIAMKSCWQARYFGSDLLGCRENLNGARVTCCLEPRFEWNSNVPAPKFKKDSNFPQADIADERPLLRRKLIQYCHFSFRQMRFTSNPPEPDVCIQQRSHSFSASISFWLTTGSMQAYGTMVATELKCFGLRVIMP